MKEMGGSESSVDAEAEIVGKVPVTAGKGCVFRPSGLVKPRSVGEVKFGVFQFVAQSSGQDVLVCIGIGRIEGVTRRLGGQKEVPCSERDVGRLIDTQPRT